MDSLINVFTTILLILPATMFVKSDHLTPILPRKGQVSVARGLINQLINNNVKNGNERPFIAGLVRLTFHDCVGHGGCDGCINHQSPSNGGLARYTSKLNEQYEILRSFFHALTMSRADFYVLAGYVALEQATVSSPNRFVAKPTFGRLECSLSPNEDHLSEEFPNANWNLPELKTFFSRDGFMQGAGFELQDIVAILGAHSLGRCSMANSGFEGKWIAFRNANGISQSDVLDNEYYKEIANTNWQQVQLVSGRWQWQQTQEPNPISPLDGEGFAQNVFQSNILINVDMSLNKDLGNINPQTGRVRRRNF
ncbi:putative ascorbate peroxidase [Clytia hemisphaerica]|uniref:putative ascorbate peroxidase n=1 Tax=Clytia hemisphaerica TaxID=252671 RepID=UPI0034D69862